ncbi:MAG TPA: isocitrate/isopropylmalate dehydrogenase family protein [Planctomycetota bacterium]|nr:isocitrate/isopropylmalate dehydrogenase family protein [Planctomycetota bacterium]
MTTHAVTLIRGDGIGPELAAVTRECLQATGVKFDWDVVDAGEATMAKEGTPLPKSVLDSLRRNKVGLKAPITTPVGTGFRSVNVALRKELDLYACVRPCRTFEGVAAYHKGVDLVIVRENTEDLYAGIEFEKDKEDTARLLETIREYRPGATFGAHVGISIKPISVERSRRIVQYAFEYARKHKRRRVTAVHKANIMKFTDGLFLEVARQVAAEYPDIPFNDRIVDNMCMQLVQTPQDYDVIVLPNLYGDILSDLCASLVGGLGVAPGANIGTAGAMFEAVHGSAPKYAGQNKVNPTALILSGVLMLRHLGEATAADRLERAVAAVLAEGREVTYDLRPGKSTVGAVGTREMGQAIIRHLGA